MRLLDLLELVPVSQSTVMHHLRVLEESGLLVSQKEGPARLYSFRREGLGEVSKWLRGLDR
jgi:DNA-binding transcriptional ArsR family regulator